MKVVIIKDGREKEVTKLTFSEVSKRVREGVICHMKGGSKYKILNVVDGELELAYKDFTIFISPTAPNINYFGLEKEDVEFDEDAKTLENEEGAQKAAASEGNNPPHAEDGPTA